MAKIERLTPEQIARFPEYVRRWTAIGLSTQLANREKAEDAIRRAYAAGGRPPPAKIVWCGSPLSQGLTRAIVLDAKFQTLVGERVRDSVWASVGASVGDSVRASVGASVWASVWASVGASVRASVGDSVRASVWASGYGSHDVNWLAFYEYFRTECGLREATRKLEALTDLSHHAGWWLPHANICWVSERHNVLARDAAGRLHAVGGPAVCYPDGWAIYAVHGVRVPAKWVEKPAELDPKTALTWPNIEQRRAAAELIGWGRIIEQLSPVIVDRHPDPEVGTLLRVDLPDSPGEQFLRVRCATGRDFVLPVPPDMKTARQAGAWTYGLTETQYRLERRA